MPKPSLWMAWVFQSGSGGLKATAEGGADAFKTPSGRVTRTASALWTVWLHWGLLEGAAQTSTPFALYLTARTAVFNRMSRPSESATGTQEYPFRTEKEEIRFINWWRFKQLNRLITTRRQTHIISISI